MVVTVRHVSGTQDKVEMNKDELESFFKWLMDDNSSNIYSYKKQYCDNSKNIYIYEKQNHTCYIFKNKIEYVDFSSN